MSDLIKMPVAARSAATGFKCLGWLSAWVQHFSLGRPDGFDLGPPKENSRSGSVSTLNLAHIA